MNQQQLFEPPPKPEPRLAWEEVAEDVWTRLVQSIWTVEAQQGFADDVTRFTPKEHDAFIEAMMAVDCDDWKELSLWLRENRPASRWNRQRYAYHLRALYRKFCVRALLGARFKNGM